MRDRGVKFIQEPKAMPWGWFAMFVNNDGCLPNHHRTLATSCTYAQIDSFTLLDALFEAAVEWPPPRFLVFR
jgi:hypothetical protein